MQILSLWLSSLAHAASGRARSRVARPRAATLLEYVLLAAVVLAIIFVFGQLFGDAVGRLVDRIVDAIDNPST